MNAVSVGTVGRGGRSAFTLIELLVVITIIAFFAGLLLASLARAKRETLQTDCPSNLKQLGFALQMYIDDNEDRLPGPLWNGLRASADANSTEQFLYYAAPYLKIPPLSNETAVVSLAVCPRYLQTAPGIKSIRDMEGRISYLLNPDVDPLPGAPVRPFGYPDPQEQPLKRSELTRYGSLAALFAISDVDQGNVDPSVGWWSDLPSGPVHGSVRNQVFFDGRVAAVEASAKAVRK